jgi:hypothetical protein
MLKTEETKRLGGCWRESGSPQTRARKKCGCTLTRNLGAIHPWMWGRHLRLRACHFHCPTRQLPLPEPRRLSRYESFGETIDRHFAQVTNRQHSLTAAMAPPRATKKYTLTNPSTAITRQSARQSRRHAIDEAEELEEIGQDGSAGDNGDAADDEAEASQNTSDGPLEQMMAKMVDDVC